MWPGFRSWTLCHKWLEFVVGSPPCSEGFSPGSLVFLSPQKPTFLNSNSIRNSRATGLSVERLLCVTLIKQSQFIYLFTCKIYLFDQTSVILVKENLIVNLKGNEISDECNIYIIFMLEP